MVQMSMLILPLTGKGLEGVIQLVVMIVDGMTAQALIQCMQAISFPMMGWWISGRAILVM